MQRQLQIRMIKKYLRLKQCSNEISKNHKSLKKKNTTKLEKEKFRERQMRLIKKYLKKYISLQKKDKLIK